MLGACAVYAPTNVGGADLNTRPLQRGLRQRTRVWAEFTRTQRQRAPLPRHRVVLVFAMHRRAAVSVLVVVVFMELPRQVVSVQIHGSFSWRDARHLGTRLNTWTPTTQDNAEPTSATPDPEGSLDADLTNPFLYPFTHFGTPPRASYDRFAYDMIGRVSPTQRDGTSKRVENEEDPQDAGDANDGQGGGSKRAPRVATRFPAPTGVVCAVNSCGTHYFLTDTTGRIRSCTWATNTRFYDRIITAKRLTEWVVSHGDAPECDEARGGVVQHVIDASGIGNTEDRLIFKVAPYFATQDEEH